MCGGVGLGEQGGQRAQVRRLVIASDGQYIGSFGGVLGGDSFYLLAGGGNSKAG